MDEFFKDYEVVSQSWWPYVITFGISLLYGLKMYVGGTQCTTKTRIDGKNVIVTGGASGMGFEVAKNLASRGGNIILAVRNEEKGKKAMEIIKGLYPNVTVELKLVDMSDYNSIKNFISKLLKEYEKIDILVNNAAIIDHPFEKNADGNELTIATNYLGPFLLTHLMLPLLNKSTVSRVINVTSFTHEYGTINLNDLNLEKNYDPTTAYNQSKLALIIFTKHMAALFKSTNITFNSVNPGLVRGTKHSNRYSTNQGLVSSLQLWSTFWVCMKTAKQGCQSILFAAVEPELEFVTGVYISDCEIKESPNKLVNDNKLAKSLYEKSCKLVYINPKKMLDALPGNSEATGDNS